MIRTIRNKLVHDPETARAIGQASAARRQAYNLAVEHCLAHPNAPYHEVQARLTGRRQADPENWAHSHLALQRPGLKQGYDAVKAFHKADAAVLKECTKEVKYRDQNQGKGKKAKPPRHGNRPERDPDTRRLFQKRGKNPECIRIDNAQAIRLVPDNDGQTARIIRACGLTLKLTKPIPAGTGIRALTLIESKPARLDRRDKRQGKKPRKNRELEDKRYEIRIHHHLSDPKPIYALETLGLDPGVNQLITDSDGEVYGMDQVAGEELEKLAKSREKKQEKLTKLQKKNPGHPNSRQAKKLWKEIRAINQKIGGIRNNQECRIAREIVDKAKRDGKNIACEKTRIRNLVRSAKGTMENPGKNVAQKAGLNRSIHRCRWGKLRTRISNATERQGTAYFEVPASYSSQKCSVCSYIDRKNRKNQEFFQCLSCNHQGNADHNAARNHSRAANPQLYRHLTKWMERKKPAKAKKTRGQG